MTETPRLKLKVEDAEQADLLKGIARIDQTSMKILQASKEDVIEIFGNKKTIAKVFPTNLENTHKNVIQIDAYTRRNAGTKIGGFVEVSKANVAEAKKLVITSSRMQLPIDEELKNYLKTKLLGAVLIKENVVAVKMLAHPVLFFVVKTEPDGIVRITEKTEIDVLS